MIEGDISKLWKHTARSEHEYSTWLSRYMQAHIETQSNDHFYNCSWCYKRFKSFGQFALHNARCRGRTHWENVSWTHSGHAFHNHFDNVVHKLWLVSLVLGIIKGSSFFFPLLLTTKQSTTRIHTNNTYQHQHLEYTPAPAYLTKLNTLASLF